MRTAILLLALSLGPGTAAAQDGGVGSVMLPGHARESVHIMGRVTSIARGEQSWWTIETDAAPPARAFALLADREADIPLRVGEPIDAAIDCSRGGFHYVCDGVVRDAAGALLIVVSGHGDPALVPEWRVVGDGPRPRGTGRVDHGLVLEHLGARVTTRPSGWTTHVATDGRWRVSGMYSHVVGGGPRVPDSVDYRQYAISRVR